jgi:hypothetical protein
MAKFLSLFSLNFLGFFANLLLISDSGVLLSNVVDVPGYERMRDERRPKNKFKKLTCRFLIFSNLSL